MKDTVVSFDEESKHKNERKNILRLSQKTVHSVSFKHQDWICEDVGGFQRKSDILKCFSGSLQVGFLFCVKFDKSLVCLFFLLFKCERFYVFWISCVLECWVERLWVEVGQSSWAQYAWNTTTLALVDNFRFRQWEIKKNKSHIYVCIHFDQMRKHGNIIRNDQNHVEIQFAKC